MSDRDQGGAPPEESPPLLDSLLAERARYQSLPEGERDRAGYAVTLTQLAQLYHRGGDLESAAATFDAAWSAWLDVQPDEWLGGQVGAALAGALDVATGYESDELSTRITASALQAFRSSSDASCGRCAVEIARAFLGTDSITLAAEVVDEALGRTARHPDDVLLELRWIALTAAEARGDLDRVERLGRELLAFAEAAGEAAALFAAHAHDALARVEIHRGDRERARVHYDSAREVLVRSAAARIPRAELVHSLIGVGQRLLDIEAREPAARAFREALAAASDDSGRFPPGSEIDSAGVCAEIGRAYLDGRFDEEACHWLVSACERYEDTSDSGEAPPTHREALFDAARAFGFLGDWEEARRRYVQLEAFEANVEFDPRTRARTTLGLVSAEVALGRSDRARKALDALRERLQPSGLDALDVEVARTWCEVLDSLGDGEDADALLGGMIERSGALGEVDRAVELEMLLGDVRSQDRRDEEALETYSTALTRLRDARSPATPRYELEFRVLNSMASTLRDLARPQESGERAAEAIAVAKKLPTDERSREELARATYFLGYAAVEAADYGTALDWLGSSRSFLETLSETERDPGFEGIVLHEFAFAQSEQGETRAALETSELARAALERVPEAERDWVGYSRTLREIRFLLSAERRDFESIDVAHAAHAAWERVTGPDRDPSEEAMVYEGLAWSYRNLGDDEEARLWFEKAVEIRERGVESSEDRSNLAKTRYELARTLEDAGDWENALEQLSRTRQDLESLPDAEVDLLQSTVHEMAFVLFEMRRWREGLEWAHRARKLSEGLPAESRDQQGYAGTLHEIGYALVELGRPGEAMQWYSQSVATMEQVAAGDRDPSRYSSFLRSLALCQLDVGDEQAARATLVVAADVHESVDEADREWDRFGEILQQLASWELDHGAWDTGLEFADRARVALERVPQDERSFDLYAQTLQTIGLAKHSGGDREGAVSWYRRSLKALERVGEDERAPEGEAVVRHCLGRVAMDGEDWASARAHFEVAIDRFSRVADVPRWRASLASSLLELAGCHEAEGDLDAALEGYHRARRELEKLPRGERDWEAYAETLTALAEVLEARGEWDAAREWRGRARDAETEQGDDP